jgi:hypothetical protein
MGTKRVRTHYDNLNVARDAPPEVIRAAYKVLSQRFHPDKNSGDERASRIMAIVNASYAVLSDANARAAHDAWIASQEQEMGAGVKAQPWSAQRANPDAAENALGTGASPLHRAWAIFSGTIVYGFYGALLLGFAYLLLFFESTPQLSQLPSYNANPSPADSARLQESIYLRPPFAPNGDPWPVRAGYLTGYPRLHTDGLSTVTVDNGSNDSDVFVKLVSIQANSTFPVRQFFMPAHGKMRLNSVRQGVYDIRYQDLGSGHLLRSESFDLEEIEDAEGIQYSNVTMTLYKVANGNFQTYPLRAEEF